MIHVDWDAVAKDLTQHPGDGDALLAARVQVFDVAQVDVTGEEREGDGAEFVCRPALTAAACLDGFYPDIGDVLAQR